MVRLAVVSSSSAAAALAGAASSSFAGALSPLSGNSSAGPAAPGALPGAPQFILPNETSLRFKDEPNLWQRCQADHEHQRYTFSTKHGTPQEFRRLIRAAMLYWLMRQRKDGLSPPTIDVNTFCIVFSGGRSFNRHDFEAFITSGNEVIIPLNILLELISGLKAAQMVVVKDGDFYRLDFKGTGASQKEACDNAFICTIIFFLVDLFIRKHVSGETTPGFARGHIVNVHSILLEGRAQAMQLIQAMAAAAAPAPASARPPGGLAL